MQNIFFTSDTHFDHLGVIEYDQRPFSSVEEMNETLINNWNETVTKSDIVYHLGDFCWRNANRALEILEQLNGQIHLIAGNHDKLNKKLRDKFTSVSGIKKIRVDGQKFILSHRPFRTWEGQGKDRLHLHGHSHGKLDELPDSFDVGCNLWNYRPVIVQALLDINNSLSATGKIIRSWPSYKRDLVRDMSKSFGIDS